MSSPLVFDPTRWLPQPSSELADSWRPFQRGQHSCMGENMMMPGLVTALLLTVRDVDVALAYDESDVCLSPELGGFAYMEGNFAAKPAKGLPVMVSKRVS
jgi:cytochrome P450